MIGSLPLPSPIPAAQRAVPDKIAHTQQAREPAGMADWEGSEESRPLEPAGMREGRGARILALAKFLPFPFLNMVPKWVPHSGTHFGAAFGKFQRRKRPEMDLIFCHVSFKLLIFSIFFEIFIHCPRTNVRGQ